MKSSINISVDCCSNISLFFFTITSSPHPLSPARRPLPTRGAGGSEGCKPHVEEEKRGRDRKSRPLTFHSRKSGIQGNRLHLSLSIPLSVSHLLPLPSAKSQRPHLISLLPTCLCASSLIYRESRRIPLKYVLQPAHTGPARPGANSQAH